MCQATKCSDKKLLCRYCIDESHKEHYESIASVHEISGCLQELNYKLQADDSLNVTINNVKSVHSESLQILNQFK